MKKLCYCNPVYTSVGVWLHKFIITFCVSRRWRDMYYGHPRLCVYVSVRGRMPTLLHGPYCDYGCNLGVW